MTSPIMRIRAQALKEIEKKNRRLHPQDVVDAAVDPKHVLHDVFEWSDSVAGNLYRLDQARALIREVRVEITSNDVTVFAPVYVSDPDPNRKDTAYVPLSLVNKEDNARRVLLDEFARIEGSLKRARAVSAVIGLGDDLDRMIEALVNVRDRVLERAA